MNEHDIQVLLVNETKVTEKSVCHVAHYNCYRREQAAGSTEGGVMILVDEQLVATEIDATANDIETKGARLGDNLVIFSAYNPARLNTGKLSEIFKAGSSVLLVGDLNCKHRDWNCKNGNTNGNILRNYLQHQPITMLHTDEPTLYPSNGGLPSVVDITLLKNINFNTTIEVINELDSDHLPVVLTMKVGYVHLKNPRPVLDYTRANWKELRNSLQEKIDLKKKLLTSADINEEVVNLTQAITSAVNKHIPRIEARAKYQPLSPKIKELTRERNRIRRLIQNSGDDTWKYEKNRLSNIIQKETRKFLNEKTTRRLQGLSVTNNSLWKHTRLITRGSDNKIPALHGIRGMAYTNADNAEALADAFAQNHTLTQDFGDEETDNEVNTTYDNVIKHVISLDEIKYISPRELVKAIKRLQPRKAPGKDGIQNIVLKNLPMKAIVQLANIYNACFKLSYFPDDRKEAHVLAFKKPGKDKAFPQNYRPISLLSTLSKLFEKLILDRILAHEKANKLLLPEQFGFTEKHSTVQQLVRLTNHISVNFNINKSTAMVLLDIEKAFDTVWHVGLIYKLNELGVPP